jgi:hypothetical protein
LTPQYLLLAEWFPLVSFYFRGSCNKPVGDPFPLRRVLLFPRTQEKTEVSGVLLDSELFGNIDAEFFFRFPHDYVNRYKLTF